MRYAARRSAARRPAARRTCSQADCGYIARFNIVLAYSMCHVIHVYYLI